jgi:fructokinase
MKLIGGIEAGGTKFVCAVGAANNPEDIVAQTQFPTTNPEETIGQCIAFFDAHTENLASLGIAAFGPVDVHPHSGRYGYITSTPKLRWRDTDLRGPLAARFDIPIGFDTDVNGAALGEHRWGAAQGLTDFVYYTIGTGIGGGAMVGGRLLHGLVHSEMGHIAMPHDRAEDPFVGACPYHGDCFEGLAAGPALEMRWGAKAQTLPPDHAAWQLEAHYIAMALRSTICMLSPQRIILGGGVMSQAHLFPMVRNRVIAYLNGYVQAPEIMTDIDTYIVPPMLGNRAGVLGAMALGLAAADMH